MNLEVMVLWLSSHCLRLAAEKTEAVVIVRTKKSYATFTMEGKTIRMLDTMKYLEVRNVLESKKT